MLRSPALACTLALALASVGAHAEKKALDDDEMRAVSAKGISIAVNLNLNTSRVAAGFTTNGVTTYAIAQGFGGALQMFAITVDPLTKPDGTSYLAIGMPSYFSAQDFGVRAVGVQTDATGPLNGSLGSILLNGTATMTGQLNLWAK
jgi:hypothetical protein